ncbi:unnamed protein product [Notodromas monacha]|uniref:snRNA-activating protein complex subunit 3 n=1 Tax=Notodromas monacha TaxID=399045 RepID=A0A7R9BQT4_9CRUS|nr:unnamed protein product [Notodromas monacha]CAG0919096.1 unnamed protein product [Notodromas monacha]
MATMERVYDPKRIPWASPVVRDLEKDGAALLADVTKTFPFREMAAGPSRSKTEIETVSRFIDVPEERVQAVLNLCSAAALGGCYGLYPETEGLLYKTIEANEGDELAVLKERRVQAKSKKEPDNFHVSRTRRYRKHEVHEVADMKSTHVMSQMKKTISKAATVSDADMDEGLVLYVKVYDVAKPQLSECKLLFRKQQLDQCRQELVLLGSQTLSELHQAIKCRRKEIVNHDYSVNPREFNAKTHADLLANHNKDAVLFIYDTLFASTNEAKEDYVDAIQEWAEKHIERLKCPGEEETVTRFKEGFMDDTTFDSLRLRIGYPYLYLHDSTCHHIVIVSLVRLYNKVDDWRLKAHYPAVRRHCRFARRVCQICSRRIALWLVVGHKDFPEEVSPFCDFCLYSILYNVEKRKMTNSRRFTVDVQKKGDFKLYRA